MKFLSSDYLHWSWDKGFIDEEVNLRLINVATSQAKVLARHGGEAMDFYQECNNTKMRLGT